MKIEIEIPDIFNYSEFDIRMYIGVSFYEKNVLGSDECAQAVGIPYTEFIRNMGQYGKSIFDISELRKEFLDALEGQT
jgi:hypothetical protein